MTNIKSILTAIHESSKDYQNDIELLKSNYTLFVDKKIADIDYLNQLVVLIKKYPLNATVLNIFMAFIELINSPELIDTYDFEDMNKFNDLIVELFPNDLNIISDDVFYTFNILDDEELAIKKYKNLKNKIDVILNDINSSLDMQ